MDHVTITDDFMKSMLTKTRPFTIVLLKKGPNYDRQSTVIWEHGRRNFSLRADGSLSIVCPISDESQFTGVGIFDRTIEETGAIMEGDPGVQAGMFVYELHSSRSFPGDALPGEGVAPRTP
jgi:hypothetical protein